VTSPSRLLRIVLPNFLAWFCFASIYTSTAAKSCSLNCMWTAASFIIAGRMRSFGRRLCTIALKPIENVELFIAFVGSKKSLRENRHFVGITQTRKKQYNYPWVEDGNQWSSTSAVPQLKLYTSIPCKCITGPIHKKCGSKTKRVNF